MAHVAQPYRQVIATVGETIAGPTTTLRYAPDKCQWRGLGCSEGSRRNAPPFRKGPLLQTNNRRSGAVSAGRYSGAYARAGSHPSSPTLRHIPPKVRPG